MKIHLGVLVILVVSIVACGDDSPSTTTTTQTTTVNPVEPSLSSLQVTGANVLRAVGESSQMTAMARYVDGSARDVTATAIWSATPEYFSVSPGGLVTVTALGFGGVSARYQAGAITRVGGTSLTATPPGTFVLHGRAREPGSGGIPDVRILEMNSNQAYRTDSNGNYQIPALTFARLRFEKDGFEPVEVPPVTASLLPSAYAEAAMQRILRLVAGQAVSVFVAPHDIAYEVGSDSCYPCKHFRVATPSSGTLDVNITWTDPAPNSLNIWLNGRRFTPAGQRADASAAVGAGENHVYVGWNLPANGSGSSNYVYFTLTTSLTE